MSANNTNTANANDEIIRLLNGDPLPVYFAIALKTDGTKVETGVFGKDCEPTAEELDEWASARHDDDVVCVNIIDKSYNCIAWYEGRGYAAAYGA